VKALLVLAFCLGCNNSTLSVTKFDTMAECDAARAAIVAHAEYDDLWGARKSFDGMQEPQCIPYVVPQ
jgi:hypothetical protein